MPGRKIALNLRSLIFLPGIFLLRPAPAKGTPPRIFETIPFYLILCGYRLTRTSRNQRGEENTEQTYPLKNY
jgi:hypothetical protein